MRSGRSARAIGSASGWTASRRPAGWPSTPCRPRSAGSRSRASSSTTMPPRIESSEPSIQEEEPPVRPRGPGSSGPGPSSARGISGPDPRPTRGGPAPRYDGPPRRPARLEAGPGPASDAMARHRPSDRFRLLYPGRWCALGQADSPRPAGRRAASLVRGADPAVARRRPEVASARPCPPRSRRSWNGSTRRIVPSSPASRWSSGGSRRCARLPALLKRGGDRLEVEEAIRTRLAGSHGTSRRPRPPARSSRSWPRSHRRDGEVVQMRKRLAQLERAVPAPTTRSASSSPRHAGSTATRSSP